MRDVVVRCEAPVVVRGQAPTVVRGQALGVRVVIVRDDQGE